MKTILLSYLATLLAFCVLDVFYLGGFAKAFFEAQLGPGILAQKPVWPAAVLFYLMYAAGVVMFIGLPNAVEGGIAHAALTGAAFGLLAYGTYDLTNMATLNGWTWKIVIVDMAWGTFATAVGGSVAAYVAFRLAD